MKLSFAMLYPFTSELYPTDFRTVGFGFSSGVGRIGAALIPYAMFPLLEGNVRNPFLLFFIAAFIASLACCTFPYDTMGVPID
jgi:nitrate/nitrite transporter NarK